MKILLAMVRWMYQILAGLSTLFVAALLASLAFQLPFKREKVALLMDQWTSDPSSRLTMGAIAIAIIALLFAYIYIKSRMSRQEPSIAFDNPDGEVSISLRAIEDFVGRIGRDFSEVKNLEPSIIAKRDGVEIVLKGELWSGSNIPKLTERIQNLVKSQVQNILGIENVHSVTLSVSKIVGRDKDYQMPAQPDIFSEQQNSQPGRDQGNIPYQS